MDGAIKDGDELTDPEGQRARPGGLFKLEGGATRKIDRAGRGEVIAIAKLESSLAGQVLSIDGKARKAKIDAHEPAPLYCMAISAKEHKDDVRLSGALAKLVEEDRTLRLTHNPITQEHLLAGQGEAHLAITLERLRRRFGVEAQVDKPKVSYRESIRKPVTHHGRHKKQTGGHGQFGDVIIEIKPGAPGSGVTFSQRITGGVVPRQWIPAVEQGVRDAAQRGPLGFPVVDVDVCLIDGSYHSVDSSEMAFRAAGRLAMSEGLKSCSSYLLEPIEKLTIHAPSTATARITAAISSRRGQILGFQPREGWTGWDEIEVFLPESERQDLIAELRGLTQGLGNYVAEFDHMAEIGGRIADEIVKREHALA